jgi:hypothetical protein
MAGARGGASGRTRGRLQLPAVGQEGGSGSGRAAAGGGVGAPLRRRAAPRGWRRRAVVPTELVGALLRGSAAATAWPGEGE